jgi:hypothetical protein
MVLVKASPAYEAGAMPDSKLVQEMGKFNEELAKAGVLLDAAGLKPSSKSKRVRFAGDKKMVVDGPFAETKEIVGGFWLWQVKSMDEAIEWAMRCPKPHKEDCEIDIRPVLEACDFGPEFTPELCEQEQHLAEQISSRNK